ncbi:MAG: toxin TcdB middle/N-terminal domain-containing protein, partial [Hyphomicrobiales bacterium]
MLGRRNARGGARKGGFASVRLIFGMVAAVALAGAGALADEVGPPVASDGQGPKQPVTAYNGSYTYSVPIEVPAFRGIEPKLKLSYDSARTIRNAASAGSWLGIGWKLDGVSAIERVSGSWIPTTAKPDKKTGGRGSPVYSDTEGAMPADAFTLDGDELIACSELTTQSPSCTASGAGTAYTGRVENYLRIRRKSSDNTWEVTAKDGTVYAYTSPNGSTFASTFRWYLATVTDRRSNHVDYTYNCAAGAECIISSIQYFNQGASGSPIVTISFSRQQRPSSEQLSFATGNAILNNAKRLTAIKVAFASGTVRAYALSYDTSASSGLSRLTSIQEYGRDAVVDSGGNVITGTALPATVINYSNFTVADSYTQIHHDWEGPGSVIGTGDFDGDGDTDFLTSSVASQQINQGGQWITVHKCQFHALGQVAWEEASWSQTGNCDDEGAISGLDFTGDGRDDFIKITYVKWGTFSPPQYDHTVLTLISYNGTSFGSGTGAVYSYPPTTTKKPFEGGIGRFGDYDGDGSVDFITQENNLWTGGIGFTKKNNWTVPDSAGGGGDTNGDGKSDIVVAETIIEGGDGTIWGGGTARKQKTPFLSNGKSFVGQTPVVTAQGSELSDPIFNRAADVNGDGHTDLVKIRDYGDSQPGYSGHVFGLSIFLATGMTYVPVGTEVKFDGYIAQDLFGIPVVDIDGDGRADLKIHNDFIRSTGAGFAKVNNFPANPVSIGGGQISGDFNGDGRPDYYYLSYDLDQDGSPDKYDTVFSTGDYPDLLINIVEPLGGKIAIEYEPSSRKPNTLLPFVMPVVKTVTVDDGRGGAGTSAMTSYDYADGSWNVDERQFMGFRTVTATLPKIEVETTGNPKTISTYQQSLPCLGKVVTVESFDQYGTRLRKLSSGITQNNVAPFTCQETSTTTAELPDSVNKRTRVSRTFDNYNNVMRLTRNGEVGFTGDESNDASDFYPNLTDYIVSCPGREITRTGSDNSGTKLKETQHFYAGETAAYTTPPQRCEETQTKAWISGTNYAVSSAVFDAFGNLYQSFDPVSHKTQHEYDQAYNLFEKKTKLPKYFDAPADTRFIILQDWDSNGNGTDDFRCEEPSRITDINGKTTERVFDGLCRVTRETRPGGDYTTTDYSQMPAPAAPATQYVETRRPAPTASSDDDDWSNPATIGGNYDQLWSRVYLDGFGRTWKELREGLSSADKIEIDRAFNDRGYLRSESAPYYTGSETRKDEVYDYDGLDRLLKQTHPDGQNVSLTHGLSTTGGEIATVLVKDESGRKTRYHFDAFGKLVERVKLYGSGTPQAEAVTQYVRDLLSRISGISDPNGNAWAYQYDGLSRRKVVDDPDLGEWTYAYYENGPLKDQIDAKGQLTHLDYDVMDRVTAKTAAGIVTTNTYDDTATAGHSGYLNVGRLTDSVRTGTTQRFDYDAAGRVVKNRWAGIAGSSTERVIDTAWWHAGELRSRTYPSGTGAGSSTYTVSDTYDNAGRLSTVKNGSTVLIASTDYDGRSKPTVIAYGNGAQTTMTYDPDRFWIKRIETNVVSSIGYDL